MKKLIFTLALLAGSMFTFADTTVPSDNVISVEPFSVKQGKTATFEILLTNTATNLAGWQIYFNVPNGFTLKDAACAERTKDVDGKDYTVDIAEAGANRYMATGYHNPQNENTVIPGTSGAIMTLTLTCQQDVELGDYTITFDNTKMGNLESVDQDCPDGSFTVTVVENALDLYDDAETLPAASTETKVIIHRAFEGGKWNSFVAPFDISAEQYEAAFGDDVQIAKLTDHNMDDAEHEIGIIFTTVTSTAANTPVIIKPSSNLTEVTFTGSIDIVVEDAEVYTPGSKKLRSYMYGTYVPKVIKGDAEEEEFPLYLKNNKLWYAPAAGVTIKGYRAYLVMNENPTAYTDQYGVKMYIDEDLTAINGIDEDRTNGKVYTVDGKYVGKDVNFNRMQKGVYIVNGKKVIK